MYSADVYLNKVLFIPREHRCPRAPASAPGEAARATAPPPSRGAGHSAPVLPALPPRARRTGSSAGGRGSDPAPRARWPGRETTQRTPPSTQGQAGRVTPRETGHGRRGSGGAAALLTQNGYKSRRSRSRGRGQHSDGPPVAAERCPAQLPPPPAPGTGRLTSQPLTGGGAGLGGLRRDRPGGHGDPRAQHPSCLPPPPPLTIRGALTTLQPHVLGAAWLLRSPQDLRRPGTRGSWGRGDRPPPPAEDAAAETGRHRPAPPPCIGAPTVPPRGRPEEPRDSRPCHYKQVQSFIRNMPTLIQKIQVQPESSRQ